MNKKAPSSVFVLSLAFCGAVAVGGALSPKSLTEISQAFTSWGLRHFDWFYLLICSLFVVFSLYMALGKFGHVRLGRDDEEPEFKTLSWLAMLFAAGMGSGLVFWGTSEPLAHFFNPPPGAPAIAADKARWALVISNLHWGIHAWSIYAISALCLAYFSFRKGTTLLASAPITFIFPGKIGRKVGEVSDFLAVLAVIFGVVGSLGAGTLLINSGLSRVFGTPADSVWVSIGILTALSVAYMLSAGTGLNRGIQILSNFNIGLALLLLLVVLITGPTHFILSTFVTSIGDYLGHLVELSTKLFPFSQEMEWSRVWTLTYLVWWIAWAPFVGIFIARISRGRTIREFVTGVIIVPTLFSMFWFAVFGGAGLEIELFQSGGVAEVAAKNPSEALFLLFEYLPAAKLLSVMAIALMFIFLVTSADSACFVLGMLTSAGSLNPPTSRKLIWGVVMGVIVVSVVFAKGGIDALKALAITGALPFLIILIGHCYCLFKSIYDDSLKSG